MQYAVYHGDSATARSLATTTFQNKQFAILKGELTKTQALSLAEKNGAHLYMPRNKETIQHLYVRTPRSSIWLGVRYEPITGRWVWDNLDNISENWLAIDTFPSTKGNLRIFPFNGTALPTIATNRKETGIVILEWPASPNE